ncbi:MAG TPA: VCBS repeat-containing protein, partial [Flavobacteriales bacterium]|nr:VCBS repeat-containing protein [Flavobacteriales bacterium]
MKRILLSLFALISIDTFAQGGEACGSAQTITSLPFSNTGNTSGSIDNYFEVCADAGNGGGGKDRVYKYTTGALTEYVDISVCVATTDFDSQLYVYQSSCSGTPYACQEDGCQSPAYTNPYNSYITNLMLAPSSTYYIVVDGFDGSSSGNFQLDVTVGAGTTPPEVPFIDVTDTLPTPVLHSGNAVGVVDLNNDGLDDIIRTDFNTTMVVELQGSTGTWTEHSFPGVTIGDPWGMCAGDYNNDGLTDLLWGDVSTTYILTNASGASSFTSLDVSTSTGAGSIFVQGANFFDINNNGKLDAVVCNDVAMSHIYVGDGAGGWTFDQSLIPLATVPASDNSGNYASIWSDINNDDKQDFFITHCRQSVTSSSDPRRIDQIFLNNGDYTYTQDVTNFTGLRSGAQGWSTTFNDFDNDGDNDCMILNYNINSQLMQNNGSGVFTDVISSSGMASTTSIFGMNVVSEDFNNDGFVDIFISGTDHLMYINNGDFTFTHDSEGLIYATNRILSQGIGDLNHDGKIDMYASYADVY